MSMTDPIADMLTRIRNGQQANKKTVLVPASKVKASVLAVLVEEGYLRSVKDAELKGHKAFEVELKYYNGKPVMNEIKRVSKPGLRQYSSSKELPQVRNGLGVAIISTSKGVMTDANARSANLGGEVLCTIF
jgi:small subunit ribosomal protein S8|tara:strand:- start:2265 stop:2660 length:396 start_codon:yes stop_codon:yes gene_type:complete